MKDRMMEGPKSSSSFSRDLGFSSHAPSLFSLSTSPFFLGEAGNNSIFNYSIQRRGKVNAHWRTALEQREQESWRHFGHIQETAFVIGQGGLLMLHIKGEETHIFRNMKGVDQPRYIWPDGRTLLCHLGWNTTGEFFLLPSAFAPPTLPTPHFVCAKHILKISPVTVLICRWSLGGKGKQLKPKQDELHSRFLYLSETCNVIVQLYTWFSIYSFQRIQ